MSIRAEAWFIHAAEKGEEGRPAEFTRESYELDDLEADEILVEPLFGSWEANISHAIERSPIDVCAARGSSRAIIGNAGTARVLEVGPDVQGFAVGDAAMMFCIESDEWGYPLRIMGYDSARSGLLSTRLKLRAHELIPIAKDSKYSLAQWAAFNNRYVTAWANWRVAYGAFRLLLSEQEFPTLNVWSWGGGTGVAEAQLAATFGHHGVVAASTDERIELIHSLGLRTVDRRAFADLQFDARRFASDEEYASRYRKAETEFLQTVHELTGGQGVQVMMDNIGGPVLRASIKSLSRHGILTTVGWKAGMSVAYRRALQSIQRNQFVHTHYARRSEAEAAMAYGEEHDWMPRVDERVYGFDEIPELARDYARGDFRMFPIYSINPV